MPLHEKLWLYYTFLTNKRLRMDVKALKCAADGYVHYALDTLAELEIIEMLGDFSCIDEICEEMGIQHRAMLEHILDLLVGRGVLDYSQGAYRVNHVQDPFTADEYDYLKRDYPYSVEWNEFLVKIAPNVLAEGVRVQESGFDDEHFVKIWDGMMDESPYSFKKIAVQKLLSRVSDGDRVLDLACGSGSVMELILRNTDKELYLTGVDNSRESLDVAKKRMAALKRNQASGGIGANVDRTEYIRYDLIDGFDLGEEYDYIFASFLFNHIPEDNRAHVIADVRGHLSENGKFGIFQPIHKSKFERVPMWVMHCIPTHTDYPYRDRFFTELRSTFGTVDSYLDDVVVVAGK
jgi:cyclopropane fatty-acyl-phospholipid synthase-like methyltransferase